MTKYWKFAAIPLLIIATVIGFRLLDFKQAPKSEQQQQTVSTTEPLSFYVDTAPTDPLTQRIGVNMTFWNIWGASPYLHNVILNPGLEAGEIDRIVVVVEHADQNSFSDTNPIDVPDDYWAGAVFDVRSGKSAGTRGVIKRSVSKGENGLPVYTTEHLPPLEAKDVVVLTKNAAPETISEWRIPSDSIDVVKSSPNPRPGSTGHWSVALSPNQNESAHVNMYLDPIAFRQSGELKLWVKAEGSDAKLAINLSPLNGAPFYSQTISPTNDWQQVTFAINPAEIGASATLQLNFNAATPGTIVYIDDVQLGPVQASETAWNRMAVDKLKQLRPAWLRDWQGQLGDTFKNRIADPYSRIGYIFRTEEGQGYLRYSYSIPEFLDLCAEIQANPWIVVPTTFSDDELHAFGQFLAAHCDQTRFSQVILEFGNENWNKAYRSASIPDYAANGAVSDHAFELIAASAGPNVNMRKMISGPYSDPSATQQILTASTHCDAIALAPSIKEGDNLFANDAGAFQQNASYIQEAHKGLAVSELDLHSKQEKAAAGSALAKRIIEGMFLNASPQLVSCFSHLVNPTATHLRPTGLAVEMLNQIIGGSLHAVHPDGTEAKNLTLAAFRTDSTWAAAIVSADAAPQEISVVFPNDGRAVPTTINTLSSQAPTDTNEVSRKVTIAKETLQAHEQTVTFTVPAYGFVVLRSDSIEAP